MDRKGNDSKDQAAVNFSLMHKYAQEEAKVVNMLKVVGITINSSNPWDINVLDNRFYRAINSARLIGLAESFIDLWWTCERLDIVLNKLLTSKILDKFQVNWLYNLAILKEKILGKLHYRKTSLLKSHYTNYNYLYSILLDPYMNTSCGYWGRDAYSIVEAQIHKMDLICRKIQLKRGMKLLDLGCGYGGFLRYATTYYGSEVIGLNVIEEELQKAKYACTDLSARFIQDDYMNLDNYIQDIGPVDRIVMIESLEFARLCDYDKLMNSLAKIITKNGLLFIQFTSSHEYDDQILYLSRHYPKLMSTKLEVLLNAISGNFAIEDVHNYTEDYCKTYQAWQCTFDDQHNLLKHYYSERMLRMWKFNMTLDSELFRTKRKEVHQIICSVRK